MEPNCYKVVYRRNGYLYSCMRLFHEYPNEELIKLRVIYRPGVRVLPKVGKLFVFDTLKNATEFFSPFESNIEIWSAYGEDLVSCQHLAYWGFLGMDTAKDFWAWIADPERGFDGDTSSVPNGTLLASSVKLLEKINPSRELT